MNDNACVNCNEFCETCNGPNEKDCMYSKNKIFLNIGNNF